MKLRGKQVVASDHRHEPLTVIGTRRDDVVRLRFHEITVDEVEVGIARDAGEQTGFADHFELIPAHVGHLQIGVLGEPDDLAGDHAETRPFSIFIAQVEQHLQAQADAEERLVGGDVGLDRSNQFESL